MRSFVRFDRKDESGSCLRDKLKQVQKTTGKKPKELNEIKQLPLNGKYIFDAWIELHNTRNLITLSSPEKIILKELPISYTELNHWNKLKDIPFNEMELKILKEIDTEYIKSVNK